MDVRIEKVSPMRVAFVRHTGSYDEVGKTWQRLFSWAGPRGLVGPMLRTLGVAYDDPEVTLPDRLRYDACLCVNDASRRRATSACRRSAVGRTPS